MKKPVQYNGPRQIGAATRLLIGEDGVREHDEEVAAATKVAGREQFRRFFVFCLLNGVPPEQATFKWLRVMQRYEPSLTILYEPPPKRGMKQKWGLMEYSWLLAEFMEEQQRLPGTVQEVLSRLAPRWRIRHVPSLERRYHEARDPKRNVFAKSFADPRFSSIVVEMFSSNGPYGRQRETAK